MLLPAGKYAKPSSVYKDYTPERDFVGRAGQSVNGAHTWPGDAKIYVSFVLNYEGGGETTLWNGDEASEPALHDLCYFRQPVKGQRDPNVESLFEYSIRAGFPRIFKLFQKHKMPFTVWAVGRSLEVTQPYAQEMVKAGHEIADHGWRWRNHVYFSGPDQEAADVRMGIEKVQAITGDKEYPSGWFIGSRFLSMAYSRAKVQKEMGVPLLYNSDCYHADTPYWVPSPLALDGEEDEGMLMMPYTLVHNDHRFLAVGYGGFSTADDCFDTLKAEFDQLYEEGLAGNPKMMTIPMHNRIYGKPGKFRALQRFVEYVASKEGVLVDTRRNVAKYWIKKYPYKDVGPTPYV